MREVKTVEGYECQGWNVGIFVMVNVDTLKICKRWSRKITELDL